MAVGHINCNDVGATFALLFYFKLFLDSNFTFYDYWSVLLFVVDFNEDIYRLTLLRVYHLSHLIDVYVSEHVLDFIFVLVGDTYVDQQPKYCDIA